MRVRYNAPVILTFTLLAVAVLVVDQFRSGFARVWFSCPWTAPGPWTTCACSATFWDTGTGCT